MKISELLTLKKYNNLILQYRELDKSISAGDQTKEISKDIGNFLEKNSQQLIDEVLFERLYKNYKNEKGKKGKQVFFLSDEEDIASSLSDTSFLTRLKDKVKKSIEKVLAEVPILDQTTIGTSKTFKIEIISDAYNYNRINNFYYYDRKDIESLKWYRHIYTYYLIPRLREIYERPTVNKQVNIDRFMICSPSDFEEKKCVSEIGLKNIGKLVVKLVEIVQTGQKLLVDDEIVLVSTIRVIQKIMSFGGVEPSILAGLDSSSTIGSAVNSERKKDEDIKNLYYKLMTKSLENKDYIGFFLKADFIKTAKNRYPEVDLRRLEILFDQVVTPYPPNGIMKFELPLVTGEKVTYFVAVETIHHIFDQMKIKDLRINNSIGMNKQHFIIFLKKLFSEYSNSKMDDSRIAKILKCDIEKIAIMRSTIESLTYVK